MSKYGVISGPYFPAFGLNTERYQKYLSVFSPNAGKCGPEITPYLDTFYAVMVLAVVLRCGRWLSTLLTIHLVSFQNLNQFQYGPGLSKFNNSLVSNEEYILTLNVPYISESCIEIKIKLDFYLHTSLWCLKWFYEGFSGLHKTFCGTIKKCENKHLT